MMIDFKPRRYRPTVSHELFAVPGMPRAAFCPCCDEWMVQRPGGVWERPEAFEVPELDEERKLYSRAGYVTRGQVRLEGAGEWRSEWDS